MQIKGLPHGVRQPCYTIYREGSVLPDDLVLDEALLFLVSDDRLGDEAAGEYQHRNSPAGDDLSPDGIAAVAALGVEEGNHVPDEQTGKQVLDFINSKCSGLPNKDMEKFTRDLEQIIEKYRR